MRIRPVAVWLLPAHPASCRHPVRACHFSFPFCFRAFPLWLHSVLCAFILIRLPGCLRLPFIAFPAIRFHPLRFPEMLDLGELFTANLDRFPI